MVPGNVIDNGFTAGATAICGGTSAGVMTQPLVDSAGNSVGQVRSKAACAPMGRLVN